MECIGSERDTAMEFEQLRHFLKVAELEMGLEISEGRVRIGQWHPAIECVEWLQLLDRIAFDACAQSVPYDLIEIDE